MEILKDAENKFIADLIKIRSRKISIGCLYLKDKSLIDHVFLVSVVEDILNNKNVSFYYCSKGVFILSPSINSKVLTKTIKKIVKKKNISEKQLENLLVFLDVKKDWDIISDFTEKELKEQRLLLEESGTQKEEVIKKILADIVNRSDLPNFDKVRKLRKKVVLVVEDDRSTAEIIVSYIDNSFRKVVAGSGREALDMYVREAPDMVFLDIELPDINGHGVLESLKAIDKNIYAVILSGHGTAKNVLKAADLEVKGFISKPISRDEIFHHINKIMSIN